MTWVSPAGPPVHASTANCHDRGPGVTQHEFAARHAELAATTYRVDARDILIEAGRRSSSAATEDILTDIALTLRAQQL